MWCCEIAQPMSPMSFSCMCCMVLCLGPLLAASTTAAPIAPPVPRQPMWLRHFNMSVTPPRCGDINIEPLFPFGDAFDDRFIFDYAQCTIEDFSSYVLERGECGKVGPDGNPRALSYTKRGNPASLGTPWLGPGGGEGGGPGDPGYPGTGGSLQGLCVAECACSTSGQTVKAPGCPTGGCPACTDENSGKGPLGRPSCLVCSPSFNKNLASNNTLVRLWCDPADPACKKNQPTMPPEKVRVLADFVPGSQHRFAWTDHKQRPFEPPTSNLTIVDPKSEGGDSYAQFSGTVYANTGYTYISTIATKNGVALPGDFKKIDLSEYAEYDTWSSIVIEAKYPKAHHCYARSGGGGAMCHFQGFKMALISSEGAFLYRKSIQSHSL